MNRAYLLIRFDPDADLQKVRHSLKQPAIEMVDLIAGPYDAVAVINTPTTKDLAAVAMRVRRCPGIRDSVTCPVLPVPEDS